jgi:hypothetical protein
MAMDYSMFSPEADGKKMGLMQNSIMVTIRRPAEDGGQD